MSNVFEDSEYFNRLQKRRYEIRGQIRLLEEELDGIEGLMFPEEAEFLKVPAKTSAA